MIPEVDDCETYWFEVSNDLYWGDYCLKDTTTDDELKKGKVNKMTLYLKPATRVRTRVISKLKEFAGDTVFVDIERKDGKDVAGRMYFTQKHFEKNWTASELFKVESGVDYKVTWTRKNKERCDTTYNSFYAKPFDTLLLRYVLKKDL